ncbi:MAG: hypothetical protein AABX14_04480 [Candidatus Aenigmatarchaeota archaeon]
MVFDIIVAAVLLAFGILSIWLSFESDLNDKNLILVLLVAIAAIIAGGWIIITKLTLALVLTKLAGLVLAGIGLFLIIGFPDVNPDYQRVGMSKAGIFIGLILIIIGAYLLFF